MNCVPSFTGRYWMNAANSECALSLHPGVVQFVFVDGSVHTLSQSIDRWVYSHLGDIDDGRSVTVEF